jgi:hypothetical protein
MVDKLGIYFANILLLVWINSRQYEIKTLNRSFFKAVVTDMSRPHFHMVDKLGIFCQYIICWFGYIHANYEKTVNRSFFKAVVTDM